MSFSILMIIVLGIFEGSACVFKIQVKNHFAFLYLLNIILLFSLHAQNSNNTICSYSYDWDCSNSVQYDGCISHTFVAWMW